MNQRLRDLSSRFSVNALYRSTGDIHLFGALFLRKALQINKSDRFIFINGHPYAVPVIYIQIKRAKFIGFR